KLNVLTPFVPAEMICEDKIEQLVLVEVKGDRKEILEIDDLIVNYGFVSSLGPIKIWGLDIEKISIVVKSTLETNIEGFFAA
ncbi:ferredoxin--NADP(+) reductase, partial [Bacillus vallismortis]|nr:ferredoxin--NADP(+) reductase [Bacillus vallismortis]